MTATCTNFLFALERLRMIFPNFKNFKVINFKIPVNFSIVNCII